MNKSPYTTNQGAIKQVAASWYSRELTGDLSIEEQNAFQDWLALDAQHAIEYAKIESTWDRVQNLDGRNSINALVNSALTGKSQRSTGPFKELFRFLQPGWAAALGACLLVVVGLAVFNYRQTDQIYTTAVGERKTVLLQDNSTIELNTDSLVKVAFSKDAREIFIEKGQVHFAVTHDPERPLFVYAGTNRVHVLGTKFDVYAKPHEMTVTLVEGQVEVAQVRAGSLIKNDQVIWRERLLPGEQVTLRHSGEGQPGAEPQIINVDIKRATSWRQNKLDFDDVKLKYAIAEFNRYLQHPVIIVDDRLSNIKIGGVFKTGDTETLLLALKRSFSIESNKLANGSVQLRLAQPEIFSR